MTSGARGSEADGDSRARVRRAGVSVRTAGVPVGRAGGWATLAACGLAAVLAVSACDASPYAAVVNSHVISQSEFNTELRYLASNRGYVAAVDQQGASSQSQVQVEGDAPGTYSNSWVSYVLTQTIEADAVHQYLLAQHKAPSDAQVAAARAVNEIKYGPLWTAFPAKYRDTIVTRDSERAVLEPLGSANPTQLESLYKSNRKYFFTQVCVKEVDVTGSLAQARQVADQLTTTAAPTTAPPTTTPPTATTPPTTAPTSGGAVTCYSQADLENQPRSLVSTIMGLAPGMAAPPAKTTFGYKVLAVVSRDDVSYSDDVKQALSVAVSQATGTPDVALAVVLAKTKIRVNPLYGTWHYGSSAATSGVQPPPTPLAPTTTAANPGP
ncbi:MAG: hypothetical protein ACR2NJ_12675 [Acidimicrobiales bacterium]